MALYGIAYRYLSQADYASEVTPIWDVRDASSPDCDKLQILFFKCLNVI
jgi:hypothetical protein